MDIDIERLKVDREYWDSVAPEGAEFYGPEIKNWCQCWYKKDPILSAYFGGCWNYFGRDDELSDQFFKGRLASLISRPPEKVQEVERKAPEYGTLVNPDNKRMEYGADHIGREVEVLQYIAEEQVYVVRFDWGLGCVDYGMIDFRDDNERLRDELGILIIKSDTSQGGVRPIVDAILARYNLEPKP